MRTGVTFYSGRLDVAEKSSITCSITLVNYNSRGNDGEIHNAVIPKYSQSSNVYPLVSGPDFLAHEGLKVPSVEKECIFLDL